MADKTWFEVRRKRDDCDLIIRLGHECRTACEAHTVLARNLEEEDDLKRYEIVRCTEETIPLDFPGNGIELVGEDGLPITAE